MRSLPLNLSLTCLDNISIASQNISEFDCCLPAYILFANSGNAGKAKKSEVIRDESGLGSGAGITPDDQSSLAKMENDNSASSLTEDDGATGPGSDRSGDKIPGEDGITSLTDGIAKFIDDAEENHSKDRKPKK